MTQPNIHLKGCRQHHLQNLSLEIPSHRVTVVTGVSGSGKSSLAYDTLYAEGQRRYLESLSPEARLWIKQLPKPDVDFIEGLSPTLAVSQSRSRLHPRATIATHTDIYDFLSLIYSHCGTQYSPHSNLPLRAYTRQEIIEEVLNHFAEGSRIQLLARVQLNTLSLKEMISQLTSQGYVRYWISGKEWVEGDSLPEVLPEEIHVIIDRLVIKSDIRDRLSGSVETALDLGRGALAVLEGREGELHHYSEVYVCPKTGHSFAPLEPRDFRFNSVHGACPDCQGRGGQESISSKQLHWLLEEDPIEQTQSLLSRLPKRSRSNYQNLLDQLLSKNKDLESSLITQLVDGSDRTLIVEVESEGKVKTRWKGLMTIINEDLLNRRSRYASLEGVSWAPCSTCSGARLKEESLSCRIQDRNIHQFCSLSVESALAEIESWQFTGKHAAISADILPQICARLRFLQQVGLGYLELGRQATSLSEGEAQRVQLATQIGAKLSGILYILDEPSLGLHRQDVHHLVGILQQLRDLGNSVVVVEHDPTLIRAADHLLELGPGAGKHGGELIFQGTLPEMLKDKKSLTGRWLSNQQSPDLPSPRSSDSSLQVGPITRHNLSNFRAKLPLNTLLGVCGVSGSGKSTLVMDTIATSLRAYFREGTPPPILSGYEAIERLIIVEQGQAGLSSRSNPATYIGLMTPLRTLFSQTRLSRARGYSPGRFSLNKKGGRCESCAGQGEVHVKMPFLPDIFVPCEVCDGKRYNRETLQVSWEGHSIADILALSAEEALRVFRPVPEIREKLKLMTELGLDYLTLGQPFNTLSGGEVQRLKLVADLAKKSAATTLYLLDEPCAGLHFSDVDKLVRILHRLVDDGHSVIVVEHHLELLRQADWLLELGPGGGPHGGELLFEGSPSQLAQQATPTAMAMFNS